MLHHAVGNNRVGVIKEPPFAQDRRAWGGHDVVGGRGAGQRPGELFWWLKM